MQEDIELRYVNFMHIKDLSGPIAVKLFRWKSIVN